MRNAGHRDDSRTEAPAQSAVLDFLAAALARNGAPPVKRIDTHGAIVFLAGDDVYKIKRAVRFPFMDFSTLDRRKGACEAEIEVNRANAPTVYLGVLPIVRDGGTFALGGSGEVVEWVVHMRRFDETMTLDRLAARAAVTPALISDLAKAILDAHERAPRRASFDFIAAMASYIDQNDGAFAEAPDLFDVARRARLTDQSRAALSNVAPILRARSASGYVRRCHGDLHLGNIALIDGQPVLFDAIEFDQAIATCDVLYDLAFTIMDLETRDLRWASNLLLNRYLWVANDDSTYGSLSILPLFLSARAAIRAKVVYAGADRQSGDMRQGARDEARKYFERAVNLLAQGNPRLLAIGGLSGTGKSRLSGEIAPFMGCAPGAIWLRSDVERKLMFGVPELARLPERAYTREATNEVYARLRARASAALTAGRSVIVDAVHARPDERAAIARVALKKGIDFKGIWLEAPAAMRETRVSMRISDASDADATIARSQQSYDVGTIDWRRIDASREAPAIADEILGGI